MQSLRVSLVQYKNLGFHGDLFVKLYDFVDIMEEMDSSDNMNGFSSDSSDSSDTCSSIAVVNSEVSSYNAETDSDDDASPIEPYQFEPSAELLHSSSEESCEEGEDENDGRLTNTDW